jgi:hypothetical protein
LKRWLDLGETAEIFNPELRQGGPMFLRKIEKMQNFVVKRSKWYYVHVKRGYQ